ncbi:unnamed protein product [Caenorhabditis bovis]|uniref:3'-5' exonuclease domain-containing protein n=1 Tax=Caenorhabditis bovis TaxID=2654633 RepID=A0A8S1ETE4_9PELO|nr:unnamed protein product [Caenorhabditis bovis]
MENEVEPETSVEKPKEKLTKAQKKEKYRQDYPEPIKSRREQLKAEFVKTDEKRLDRLDDIFFGYFEEDFAAGVNIFGTVVDHFKAMPDKSKQNAKNLATMHLKAFQTWLDARDDVEDLKKKYLTIEIQIAALQSCTGSTSHYYDLLAPIFDFSSDNLEEEMKKSIQERIAKKEFKEAAEIVIANNMQKYFGFQQLIVPLILQDRTHIVMEYIKNIPTLQKEYVQWYDHFIGMSEIAVSMELEKWEGSMTVKPSRFCGKSLEKYMNTIFNKLAKEYDLDITCEKDAPKYNDKKLEKALKHFVGNRYDPDAKQIATDDVYFQQIRSTLNQSSRSVVEEFLFYLWTSNDKEKQIDALSWIFLLNIDPHSKDVPGKIRDYFRDGDRSLITEAKELLQIRLSKEIPLDGQKLYLIEGKDITITIVKNDADLEILNSHLKFYLDSDEDEHKFVGFDTEWRPSHLCTSLSEKIAIMQLYFGNQVWIVDCVELERNSSTREESWKKFANRLLKSKLQIIGFDLPNDIDALLSIKMLKNYISMEEIKNVYCLKRLTENINDIDPNVLGLEKRFFKLSDLTKNLLGIQLNKTEQCSNWQARPLRKDQIVYAAMDAYVVILKDHKDPTKRLQRPYEIKCIVDTMLLGWGKHLRRVGIDVIIPSDCDAADFLKKIRTMKKQGGEYLRYILTVPSKNLLALRGDYGQLVIDFPDVVGKLPIEQLCSFFDKFNIDIRPDDVFLRCTKCNSRCLLKFPSPYVHFLHQYHIIFLQNVYRSDMKEFPLEYWIEKMRKVNKNDYEGIEVKLTRPSEESDWIVATTSQGSLHITRNIVIHNNRDDGVRVRISKVPDDTFQRPNLVFSICGDCGTVFYDGKRNKLFNEHSLDSKVIKEKARKFGEEYVNGDWKDLDLDRIEISPITGGQSNLLFLVSAGCELEIPQFLIRIYCQLSSDEDVMTNNLTFALLAERGLGPKLYGFFKGGRLEEFLHCTTFNEDDTRIAKNSEKIGKLFPRYHEREFPIQKSPRAIAVMRDMIEVLRIKGCEKHTIVTDQVDFKNHPETLSLEMLTSELDEFEKMAKIFNETVVFCHNDLAPANILEFQNGNLMFIDYEYGCYNWRGYDVGMHMSELAFDYRDSNGNGYKIEQSMFVNNHPNFEIIARSYIEQLYNMKAENPKRIFPKTDDKEYEIGRFLNECLFFFPLTNLYWAIWSLRNHYLNYDNGINLEMAANDRFAIYFYLKSRSKQIYNELC